MNFRLLLFWLLILLSHFSVLANSNASQDEANTSRSLNQTDSPYSENSHPPSTKPRQLASQTTTPIDSVSQHTGADTLVDAGNKTAMQELNQLI